MTSTQDSSKSDSSRPCVKDVESLAGLFHPHAIEVQDFSYYALILDVRSQAEFDDDHIPGAVRLSIADYPVVTGDGKLMSAELPQGTNADVFLPLELAMLLAPVKLDQAILVYCGRGGRDSLPVARAMRRRGWTVDVLPGGWINYRRWVQAGLESLPRLIAFRVVSASLGGEMERLLAGLSRAGQQVLDLVAIAGWRVGSFIAAASAQPTQARFESRLLQALRQIDPRRTLWVVDADQQLGGVRLPGALVDALAVAPTVAVACPLAERLACWREDEPLLNGPVNEILQIAATASPSMGLPVFDEAMGQSDVASLLARLLADKDERWHVRAGTRGGQRSDLPALVIPSLAPDRLLEAIDGWLPQVQPPVRS